METHAFRDFDAFANAVRDVDSTMLPQNPARCLWVINHVYLPDSSKPMRHPGGVYFNPFPNGAPRGYKTRCSQSHPDPLLSSTQ